MKDRFLELLKSYIGNNFIPIPDELEKSFIDPLKDFSIYEENSKYKKEAENIIKNIAEKFPKLCYLKGNLAYEAFKILRLFNIFEEDENLLIHKYNIKNDFLEDILLESQKITIIQPSTNRLNLTHLYSLTIDGDETRDFDDAIAVEELEDGSIKLYVHIADVAEYIKKDSLLDITAKERFRTLYLVKENIYMLPQGFSYDILALKADKDSLCISYEFSFDKDMNLLKYNIYESLVHISKNYSYQEVDEFLNKKPNQKLNFLPKLLKLCEQLQKIRLEEGKGIDILLENISPRIKNNNLYLKNYNPKEYSAFIIRELMILTNHITAKKLFNSEIPNVYISQEMSGEAESLSLEERKVYSKKDFQKLGKIFKKSYLDTENIGHFALGLDCYTQATSPIRRYMDIVVQRQLKQLINNKETLYTEEELKTIIKEQEQGKSIANLLEAERIKYYLLKYLMQNCDNIWKGNICKILNPTNFLVEIKDVLIMCKVKSTKEHQLWENVEVKLHSIYPRLGMALGVIV